MNQRLIHDTAWAASAHVVELFAPLLREEEMHDARIAALDVIKAALEIYELHVKRMQKRLKPGHN